MKDEVMAKINYRTAWPKKP